MGKMKEKLVDIKDYIWGFICPLTLCVIGVIIGVILVAILLINLWHYCVLNYDEIMDVIIFV